ncbi:MAG: winged helix-turn-helix transcriptional regulator [Sphingobium sp.]|nr:winged helix-turn-helix transcriptional regulator [Sphingobium sp.]
MQTDPTPDDDPAFLTSARRWKLFGLSHLPYRILLLAKMIDRVTSLHVREEASMTLAEWRVISHVEVMGRCSASEIADAAFVDRAEVSRAVTMLEARRMVEREPNPRNRRSSLISLTDEGRRIYLAVRGERSKMYEDWLVDLTEAERAQLDHMLNKVMRRVLLANPGTILG